MHAYTYLPSIAPSTCELYWLLAFLHPVLCQLAKAAAAATNFFTEQSQSQGVEWSEVEWSVVEWSGYSVAASLVFLLPLNSPSYPFPPPTRI